jgi:hypothetical protein
MISEVQYCDENMNFAADSLMDHTNNQDDSLDYISATAPVEKKYLQKDETDVHQGVKPTLILAQNSSAPPLQIES